MNRESLSQIEQELLFKEWCKQNGIKQFLFDGDDTLWGVHAIFKEFIAECCRYLASTTSITKEVWREKIGEVDDGLFETLGVNPRRWEFTMMALTERNGLPEATRLTAIGILGKIYQTPPAFLPGAEETLLLLKKAGVPIGVVTHANHGWTMNKYHWLKLDRFFDWDNICIINEDGHKTEEEWRKAIEYFGCQPNEVAVVGDSPRSDINPAQRIGVKNLFLVEGDIPRWSVYNQEVDRSVVIIRNLTDLISFAIENYAIPFR